MSDRFVRQIDPRPNDEVVTPKRMSDYSGTANIVLVGDPGAGKSHLFNELAQAAKTNVQSARAFLNAPPGPAGATLFIDALDERRAGRSDQAVIDLIVQKLFTVNAARVRLACREHDWLGGTAR
jgi:GTPase SAR1 family protein